MGKKKPGYTRTTISVPADLKGRMNKVKEDVNWSALACQAFQGKLAEIAAKKERKTMIVPIPGPAVADLLAACAAVIGTAESAHETGHAEGEVVGANWDVLGPMLRAATARAVNSPSAGFGSSVKPVGW